MTLKNRDERREELQEIKNLLQSKENKQWYYKQWSTAIAQGIGIFFTGWGFIQGSLGISVSLSQLLFLSVGVCVLIAAGTHETSRRSIKGYLHKKVETERPGCFVEIRVVDSYLTNAFKNYPKSTMLIGLNKAFWFQEAEPGSLVADMWKDLSDRGVAKEDVQRQIDEALEKLKKAKGDQIIDPNRPHVQVRKQINAPYPSENKDKDFIIRDNYKIGTIVGVDLKYTDPDKYDICPLYELISKSIASGFRYLEYNITKTISHFLEKKRVGTLPDNWNQQYTIDFPPPDSFTRYMSKHRISIVKGKSYLRKLYFIANAEVVQGMDSTEPVKVDSDKKVSVAETFENIWEFFEQKEPLTENPPKSWLYQPLLIPLIGAGVANEGYTDLEIFSKLVDLYYKHLRKSIRQGTPPAIPRMIINIQNKTAIKNDTSSKTQERKIDIETAFWYLDYKNQVNPPIKKQVD